MAENLTTIVSSADKTVEINRANPSSHRNRDT